jgi:hypothetical protein
MNATTRIDAAFPTGGVFFVRIALGLLLLTTAPAWAQNDAFGNPPPAGVRNRPPMRHRTWGWQFM